MNDRRKSDSSIVPRKPSNEIGRPIEEEVEGRGLAKGNLVEHDVSRTQSRTDAHSALERVRQAAPLVRLGVMTQGKSRMR